MISFLCIISWPNRTKSLCLSKILQPSTRKCCHFDEIFVTLCTESYQTFPTSDAAIAENFVKMIFPFLWSPSTDLWYHWVKYLVYSTYGIILFCLFYFSSQWRHNGRDGVSNHQPRDWGNRLFRKKTSKLCVSGLCERNSAVTGEFPAQRASNAEDVSIWWRHHVTCFHNTYNRSAL